MKTTDCGVNINIETSNRCVPTKGILKRIVFTKEEYDNFLKEQQELYEKIKNWNYNPVDNLKSMIKKYEFKLTL